MKDIYLSYAVNKLIETASGRAKIRLCRYFYLQKFSNSFIKTNNPNVFLIVKKFELLQCGWGSWIRTNECQSQSLMPYRLAIPQFHLFTCVILSNFSIFCKHFAMPFLTFFQIRQKRLISLVFSVLPASMIEYIPSSHTEVSSCYSAKS